MTASVLIGVISLICLTAMGVCVAVTSRRSVSDAFRALERIELRHEKNLSTVLDRLMTIRWEDFAAIQAAQDDEDGGFIAPSEQGDREDEDSPSHLKQIFTMRSQPELSDEEREMLAEDFPEEMGAPR